ncbi:hypothetical protein EV424DRAFT_926442 [Suillus variegatus]|nr:hypothetical protein EV424DRAFT_926442 [Suillus variegatus]
MRIRCLFTFCTMHNLDVAPAAKIQDVLSVPTQFSIAPSGSLPVAAFLQLALPTALETNASATTRFVFSKKSPMLQLPMGFVSRSVPPLQTASSLRDHASGALQDGIQSVIHPSFPDNPLPLWEPQFAAVTTDSSKEVDVEGRGKRRRVANTQYKDFWQH